MSFYAALAAIQVKQKARLQLEHILDENAGYRANDFAEGVKMIDSVRL
jgi:hypothetical protein